MKYLKYIKFIILAMISILIGIAVAAAIYGFDVNSPWWSHILVIIGVIFVTLTVHELTHALVFSLQKIRIKAIYLFIFMFIRKKKFFTLKVNPKLIILGGGLVVPLLPPVTNDEELEELSKKIAKSLIAAPIASIVFGFLWFIAFIFVLAFSSNMALIALGISSTITILVLTLLVVLASSVANDQIAGDFVAYEKILDDKEFKFNVIDSYLHFNPEAHQQSLDYLRSVKDKYLLTKYLGSSQTAQSFIQDYINAILFHSKSRNYQIEERIMNMNKSLLNTTNEGITTLFMITYLYYINGEVEEAFKLLAELEKVNNPKINSKHLNYEIKRAHHLLNLSDESEYLLNPKNIYDGFDWVLAPVLDKKEEINLEPLKPGIKVPKIKLYQKI